MIKTNNPQIINKLADMVVQQVRFNHKLAKLIYKENKKIDEKFSKIIISIQ